jgi:hypothetical protein
MGDGHVSLPYAGKLAVVTGASIVVDGEWSVFKRSS